MKKSLIIYLIFLVFATIGIIYGNSLSYSNLRIWEFENILFLFIALPFIFLLPKAKLNQLYESSIPVKNQIYIPLIIGMAFGILDLLIIEYVLPHERHTVLPPYTQPFPYSIFLYFSGALEIEVFYRLIPISIILFLFTRIKNGAYINQAFVVAAILTSLREPLEQLPSGPNWFIVYSFITGVGMNYIQAYFFRVNSFVSSLTVRLGHYLIWHIINGIIIQYLILK